MKFFYAVGILTQLAIAFFVQNESKAAFLLYLWSDLSKREVQVGSRPIKSPRVPKYKETKLPVSDSEYPLFLEP